MDIDGRYLSQRDILLAVRERLADGKCSGCDMEVWVSSKKDAKQIKAFASMTGCDIKISSADDYFIINITGGTCGCG